MGNEMREKIAREVAAAAPFYIGSKCPVGEKWLLAADRILALVKPVGVEEVLRRINKPLGNPPEEVDGKSPQEAAAWWRTVAIEARTEAAALLERLTAEDEQPTDLSKPDRERNWS